LREESVNRRMQQGIGTKRMETGTDSDAGSHGNAEEASCGRSVRVLIQVPM
jgi:hypothetical protein